MRFFGFLGRKKDKTPADRAEMSRIDFLLQYRHDDLEGAQEAFRGLNFLQLVEAQLIDGKVELATRNIASQVKDAFELANLYWGRGDLGRAETYLRLTLDRNRRLLSACTENDLPVGAYHAIQYAKCAGILLQETEDFAKFGMLEPGYEPWFFNALLDCCLESRDFDAAAWQAAADIWTRKRYPKYRLDEFAIYVNALTGGYASADAMLDAHQRMFVGRAKRNPDAEFLDGYQDNDLVIDYVFAAILKRIGWEGTYRHSWPHTDVPGAEPRTTREPDRYVRVIDLPDPERDDDSGIIKDEQVSRRFIDTQLLHQKDYDGVPVDATRPARERGKVARALVDLGWVDDPASLDLMRAYRMGYVENDSTHLSLCDPVNGSGINLAAWTSLLSNDFGLHPDFIALAGSEDKSDYLDPQGAWYVLWKRDKRVYAVQRDDWDRPDAATSDAKLGLTLWPSYTSFVAWWVSEHLRSQA